MKKIILLGCFFITCCAQAQTTEGENKTEQAFENLADNTETENNEDDNYLQFLEGKKSFKLDINTATTDDLKAFYFINNIQAKALIDYRKATGNFISIYELQSIPFWTAETVRKMLPFVEVGDGETNFKKISSRLSGGKWQVLSRLTRIAELSKGYKIKPPAATNYYLGSPNKVFVRIKYQYKNLLQYGILGEKDAGEKFKFDSTTKGFDNYSFHLQIRQLKKIDFLTLGDFTVNYGQGLISYQGLAFKKSADALAIERQGESIRPYLSLGEYNFQRGAAVGFSIKKIKANIFAGYKSKDANVVIDPLAGEDYFTSLQTSGLHRTKNELADKHTLQQASTGGQLQYNNNNLKIGAQAIYYKFSQPWQKANDPYNRFSITGSEWGNASIDYNYTYKNIHIFGETAIDFKSNIASVNGLMATVDRNVDVSILHRKINKAYQALNANAFTEGVFPNNETGLYAGTTMRPYANVRIDAYADMYKFGFVRYLTNAPTNGYDYMVQIAWKYKKVADMYLRFRNETKPKNFTNNLQPIYEVTPVNRKNFRAHIAYKFGQSGISMRMRTDAVFYKQGTIAETGSLQYIDLTYKPMLSPLTASVRLQYHQTDGYNSRIYAYENDVQYSFSIPAFYGKGARYYANLNYDLRLNAKQTLSFWLRMAQTLYTGETTIGSGLDEIQGNKKTEWKLQMQWTLR